MELLGQQSTEVHAIYTHVPSERANALVVPEHVLNELDEGTLTTASRGGRETLHAGVLIDLLSLETFQVQRPIPQNNTRHPL